MRVDFPAAVADVRFTASLRARRLKIRCTLFAVLAAGLSVSGHSALAQETDDNVSEENSDSVASGGDGKVCQYEDITGSRMRKRVCHTPERWEAREMAAKNLVRELDAKPVAGENNVRSGD